MQASAASYPFDWLEFAIVGTLIFAFVALVRAFLIDDDDLPKPRVKKFFLVLPFLLGMAAGAAFWSEGRGYMRGMLIYGNFSALASHTLWQGWKALAAVFPSLMPQFLAQKLGVKLPVEASAAAAVPPPPPPTVNVTQKQ